MAEFPGMAEFLLMLVMAGITILAVVLLFKWLIGMRRDLREIKRLLEERQNK